MVGGSLGCCVGIAGFIRNRRMTHTLKRELMTTLTPHNYKLYQVKQKITVNEPPMYVGTGHIMIPVTGESYDEYVDFYSVMKTPDCGLDVISAGVSGPSKFMSHSEMIKYMREKTRVNLETARTCSNMFEVKENDSMVFTYNYQGNIVASDRISAIARYVANSENSFRYAAAELGGWTTFIGAGTYIIALM
jgi:hypothetical protein